MKRLFLTTIVVGVMAVIMSGCEKEETFTVQFDSKGGSFVAIQTVKKGEKVSRPSDPTRDNYDFVGWSTADNSTSSLWDFNNGTVEADMTLYARWTAKGGGGGDGTPLGAEDAFEFKYLISGDAGNTNPPEDVGIMWESIIPFSVPKKARFVPVPSTERFVELTKAKFDAIKTKEALKKAHEDGAKSPSFEWTKWDFEDGPKYFITKNGTTYSLVQMISLTEGTGWNYAVIRYRQ